MATKKNYTIQIYCGNEFKFQTGSRGLQRAVDTAEQWIRHNTDETLNDNVVWDYCTGRNLHTRKVGKYCILIWEQKTAKPVRMEAIVKSTTVAEVLEKEDVIYELSMSKDGRMVKVHPHTLEEVNKWVTRMDGYEISIKKYVHDGSTK